MAALAIGLGGAIGELWVQDGLLLMMALGLLVPLAIGSTKNNSKTLRTPYQPMSAPSIWPADSAIACRTPTAAWWSLKELVEQTRKKRRRSFYEDRLEALRKSASKARAEMASRKASKFRHQ